MLACFYVYICMVSCILFFIIRVLWGKHHPIRRLTKTNKVEFYLLLDLNSNNILLRLIPNKDMIFAVLKLDYNGSISQIPGMYDCKYIFKDRNLYYFTLSERSRLCEL